MLEVGRVVRAGREHHRAALVAGDGRDRAQRLREPGGIVIDAVDARGIEDAREHALAEDAILDDVRHAGGRAQVVLEDAPRAVRIADEIDPGDVDAHAARGRDAAQRGPVAGGSEDHLGGDHARSEDPLLAVQIVEEEAQGPQALLQAALEAAEVRGGHDARQRAEREDLLGAAGVAVDGERDALLEQRGLGGVLSTCELVGGEAAQELRDARERAARHAVGE